MKKIAEVLFGIEHTVHVTKSGMHKIECKEPLKNYVVVFDALRALDIRFELSMPAVVDIDDELPFEHVIDSGTLRG